ncbi:MAG TPA: AsmA family protein [Candidatus Omnitrophota bacterium]|nr:AsmA family protein [Candidatus Omnitrophota bacterium]
MKVLRVIGISLFALVIVLTAAVVIIIKTFDVNRYKPQITAQAKAALGRDFDFDRARLDISFTRGISVKVSNLVIGDDRGFQEGDFLRVKEISVSMDVLGYLLRKKINVHGIVIDTPRATIIRRKDGLINAAAIGKKENANANAASPGVPSVQGQQSALALPAVLVSSFTLQNGAVTYIDRSFEPPVSLDVTDISVSVSGISLSEPFPFKIEAAVLAPKKNINIEGNVCFDPATNEITILGLTASTGLADLILSKLPVAFPMIKDAPLPENVKGLINVKLDNLKAGPKGLGALNAVVTLSDASLKLKEMASPLEAVSADVRLTQADAVFNKLSLSVKGGRIECSGTLKDYAGAQGYNVSADIKDMAIQDLIAQDKAPFRAEGLVSGLIKAGGTGFSPDAVRSNLSATADILLAKARLSDLNVLRAVLDRITVIPGLSAALEAGLPRELKKKLTQKDTEFSDMRLPVAIENGRLRIKDASIGTEDFFFIGLAEAGFDGSYVLEGAFVITRGFSEAMVAAVPQLQYLFDEKKQIYIPLRVSGASSQVKFNVDLDYIGKRLLENQAKQQVFKAIDKALGGSPASSGSDAGAQGQEAGSATAVKDAVGSIIGNIFKK